ncbi:glycoside hydrolase family 3 N-terminal domain-containing protein [Vibrio sp. TH_r3]|uniref:glycoside hydrolase family 3 protein n=1 Tax=Vibrio sp. TH_r3 TaxID=3082084 RepID=UPI0029530073|nr:glycoside hydrolase family 3 N-terminal domain-containing protein [Vibrio sp. TH_r3]MDV7103403.1 glycoside hydrolase family 3 N-terminal domain-containing protein [Vibrio sp. TH_r3]
MTSPFITPYFLDWPKIQSAIPTDVSQEEEIKRIVGLMTLQEKVGQMIQPDIRGISVEEAAEYKIGSILNGGGGWPNEDKHASAKDWASKSDEYWFAVERGFEGRPFRIPFMWATDAVHGHNNVFGATVFPHNIGLGCARDPELIEQIGRITAIEIAATGLDWTFAPTVATPRDLRWGRVYEGYSEDPEIVYSYAEKMVQGLQGSAEQLKDDKHVISNVKHWVGDGGTLMGVDRGVNNYSEDLLRNIHAMGYFSGLNAGAQVVMSSFNSWDDVANYDLDPEIEGKYNYKIHGSKYLLTDVLKEKMGFDGLVVTDWHGHSEVSKCTDDDASYAINAGNDILMIPVHKHWLKVYHKTIEDVNAGAIPLARIDDAVSRILRVKMRAGLWDKPQPTHRSYACNQALLGAEAHREVARDAVRKSLVLLKNNSRVLPLGREQKIVLTGSAADDLQKQSGGWNLTWQGDENTLADFPGATTVKMALEEELGQDKIIYDPDLQSPVSCGDIAIVVFGEDPYAEMMGDIKAWQTLEFAALKRSYKADLEKIRQLHAAGAKVISIFYSGRPLYVNEEISKSEAFIAGFLPGSEGRGISDLLIADESGKPRYDFVGRLSFSWPNKKRSTRVHRVPAHIPGYVVPDNEQDPTGEHKPLFEYGYGLSYGDESNLRYLDNLPLDDNQEGQIAVAAHPIHMFGVEATVGDYQLKISDSLHPIGIDVSRNNSLQLTDISTSPFNYQQQQDAVKVEFKGRIACLYLQTSDGSSEDLSGYDNHAGQICFDVNVEKMTDKPVYLALQTFMDRNELSSAPHIDITSFLPSEGEGFTTVSIPCDRISSHDVDFRYLVTPFMLFTEGTMTAVIANIRWNI